MPHKQPLPTQWGAHTVGASLRVSSLQGHRLSAQLSVKNHLKGVRPAAMYGAHPDKETKGVPEWK